MPGIDMRLNRPLVIGCQFPALYANKHVHHWDSRFFFFSLKKRNSSCIMLSEKKCFTFHRKTSTNQKTELFLNGVWGLSPQATNKLACIGLRFTDCYPECMFMSGLNRARESSGGRAS